MLDLGCLPFCLRQISQLQLYPVNLVKDSWTWPRVIQRRVFSLQRRGKEPTEHCPEVILNNFSTRLGHSIGRLFAALFPQDPQFLGRQVATFHNQRDFIFFRFHRWGLCVITLPVMIWEPGWSSSLSNTSESYVAEWALYCLLFRYMFKNEKKVGIQELGPRFTLKLRSLQKGTFDSKFGEYEWVLKVSHSKFNQVCSRCHHIVSSLFSNKLILHIIFTF